MNDKQLADADEAMKVGLRSAEFLRRERPSITPGGMIPGVMDYAASGNVMELAMGHLRESIPSGQKARTQQAWLAMKEAVRQHELWLRARGYL